LWTFDGIKGFLLKNHLNPWLFKRRVVAEAHMKELEYEPNLVYFSPLESLPVSRHN
jgi:hypothetical protein